MKKYISEGRETLKDNMAITTASTITTSSTNLEYLVRLASFVNWSGSGAVSAIKLARCGFMCSRNKIVCPLCELELEHLDRREEEEDFAELHRRLRPDCRLAVEACTNATTRRPPADESIIPSDSSTEICEESRRLATLYKHALRRKQNVAAADFIRPEAVVDRLDPDFKSLRRERTRLDTFYDWPPAAHAAPADLAREGFFYAGSSDRVRCAFCRNYLRSWVPGDDPRSEHRKHFPQCEFVRNLDVGNVRIDDGERKNPNLVPQVPQVPALNFRSPPPPHHPPPPVVSVESSMRTPAVRAVLEMGFPEDKVQQIVRRQIENTGVAFLDAETLVERLLSDGVSQSAGPLALREESPGRLEIEDVGSRPLNGNAQSTNAESNANAHTSEDNKQGGSSKKKRKKRAAAMMRKKEEQSRCCTSEPGEGAQGGNHSDDSNSARDKTSPVPSNSFEDPASAFEEEQQLLEENARLKEARTCKVCMDKEVNTVFLPCGHLICCNECAPQVRNCPLCRTFIRGTVKTFLS